MPEQNQPIFDTVAHRLMREATESLERAFPVIDAKLHIVIWKMQNRENAERFGFRL